MDSHPRNIADRDELHDRRDRPPMTLSDVSDAAARISDIYAGKYGIARDDDWFLLKLQEELGELAQAHLRLSSRGRGEATEQQRADEAADVLCQLLLYFRRFGIDPEEAVRRKWLRWLEPQGEPADPALSRLLP